jgi:hypothetical protein
MSWYSNRIGRVSEECILEMTTVLPAPNTVLDAVDRVAVCWKPSMQFC